MVNSKFESSVDEILKTVQQRQAAQPPSNDDAVNDILAGLGMGDSLYRTLKKPAEQGTAPGPAAKPAPKPAVKPEPKPAPKPAVKPEPKPEPKPAVKPEPKPEPKPAVKPEPKPESKPAVKPEPEPDPKPAPKPEFRSAVKPEPEPAPAPAAEIPAPEEEPTREFDPVSGPTESPAEKPAARRPDKGAPHADGLPVPSGEEEPAPRNAVDTAKAIRESVEKGPSVRPLETKSGVLHLNEIVDDEFTKFFSESVAVVPPEEESGEEPGGFFRRRRRREKTAGPPEEVLRPDHPDAGTGEIRLDSDAIPELEGPPEEEEPAPRRRFVLPRFLGIEEPEEEGPFEEEEQEPYLDDYSDRQDAPSVQADLTRMRASLRLRCVLTGLAFALLLYLGLCAGGLLPAIPSIDPAVAPAAYLGVSLLVLLVAAAVSLPVMRAGLAGLFAAPSPDSMPALAVLAAAAQLIVFLLRPEGWAPAETTLFAAAAVLLLCLNAAGKQMMSDVVGRNFEIVSSGIDHVAAYRLRDKKLAGRAAAGLAEPEPNLLVSRPTALVKGFLHQSFSERWSDRLAQRLCWGLSACAVLAAVITAVKGGGVPGAVTVLAGALCLGGPLSCTLLSAVPSLLMQQSASRVGAVVPGWSAVQEMSRANVVVVGARDLFPSPSVVLHGIKTFEKERIDLAILYAASVLIEGCDTLRDVFLSIIQSKTEMLYPVENLTHEVGLGFTAWVEHNRVIIGGRAMMQAHDIDIPSMDYEDRYTRNGRYRPVYLAVSGKLFGMFVVSYRPDPDVADVLAQLARSGISVLVQSDDFSVTAPLIQRVYRVREGSVKVLSGEDRRALAPATAYLPESEGCMTHLGSFASFVGGLQAAEGAASGERAAALVQAVSVVCSCVLALLLAFTGGLAGLALPALILYQAAWSALAIAMPLLKKY